MAADSSRASRRESGNGWLTLGVDLAVAFHPSHGVALAGDDGVTFHVTDDPVEFIAERERIDGPRWIWWDRSTPDQLVERDVSVRRCWDILTVHRLLHGGWRTSPAHVWAWMHDLPTDSLPTMGQLDLLTDYADGADDGDPEDPVRPDGHLRPEWCSGGWAANADRLARWAQLTLEVSRLQQRRTRHPRQKLRIAFDVVHQREHLIGRIGNQGGALNFSHDRPATISRAFREWSRYPCRRRCTAWPTHSARRCDVIPSPA